MTARGGLGVVCLLALPVCTHAQAFVSPSAARLVSSIPAGLAARGVDEHGGGYLGMSLPAEFRPFADHSPWNTPIPPNPALDPNSEAMIATMGAVLNQLGSSPNVRVALHQWTLPIHVIDSTQTPRIDVPGTGFVLGWTVDPDGNAVAEHIPMPTQAWQDPESDGHMALVDPQVMLAWEFSKAQPLGAGQWRASGVEVWDLSGPGWRPPFVGPSWWRVGSVAAGMPFFAGVVRVEEIQAGTINHALMVGNPSNRAKTLPNGDKNELCPPAANTDGWGIGEQYIPEGARLQLDPDLDLDALGLSEEAKVVARAMQEYGMFVGLNGPSFALYFQNLGPTGGKWASVPGVFDILNVPTSSLRVLACETIAKDAGGGIEHTVGFGSIPGQIIAGQTMDPIQVHLINAAGQPVFAGREFDITMAIGMREGTNPGRARLGGTVSRRTINGAASFDDLAIDMPGEGYQLFAMPIDLDVAVTAPFAVACPPPCYADCDGSGTLNILDYICFGDDYANSGTYADCDGSGALNILDYICFGDAFAAGCP